jgi:hypothetical protein
LVTLDVRRRCIRLAAVVAGVRAVAVGRAARTVWTGATRGRGPGIVTVLVEWIAMLVVMRVLRVRPGSSFYRKQIYYAELNIND